MTTLPPAVLAALDRSTWVHALGMSTRCEGCANDGEPGYCRGAKVGPQQDDDAGIWCHCGHEVVLVELPRECMCSPDGWHCPSEDSEHWADGKEPDAPCGLCGAMGRWT